MSTDRPKQTCLEGPFAPGPAWYWDRVLTGDEIDRLYEAGLRSKSEAERVATQLGGRPITMLARDVAGEANP